MTKVTMIAQRIVTGHITKNIKISSDLYAYDLGVVKLGCSIKHKYEDPTRDKHKLRLVSC